MKQRLTAIPAHLLPGEAMERRNRNREYLMSLTAENLLRSHYLEAGLIRMNDGKPEGIHWGWDSPMSEIRGTFCGHWLSAAAHLYKDTGDEELLARANYIVSEIARCQEANGGVWAFPIPEKYMQSLKAGKHRWAPQYVCHKNMMGLLDMYRLTGNRQALEILLKCASWFKTFTDDISREQMSDMMDSEETGGLMEFWADLYAVTQDENHLILMQRYERPRLAEPLLAGVDVLTNMHANTTIPEIHGYARGYEVTGNPYYRSVVEAYWTYAVEKRAAYATGGQTSGEVWTPMGQLKARLGEKNQEHCTVYNMMRLAEYLLRWTGDAKYADYWEKNLYNGIYAQGYWKETRTQMAGGPLRSEPTTVAYYLPLKQGAVKHWGSRTEDFWCCHCTLVQANAVHHEHVLYTAESGVVLSQFIPVSAETKINGIPVNLNLTESTQAGEMLKDCEVNRRILSRPHTWAYRLKISTDQPVEFDLAVRVPQWADGPIQIIIDGKQAAYTVDEHGFAHVCACWKESVVEILIGKKLTCCALPDDPDMVAFVDGPVCLAGLVPQEHLLYGNKEEPENSLLCTSDERQWQQWRTGWKTYHQPVGIEFKPLYEIGHEPYTVYFPIAEKRKD